MNTPNESRSLRILTHTVVVQLLLLLPIFLCASWCCATLFWDDVYRTLWVAVQRYPESELIYVGYGVYGSGDFGTKVYVYLSHDPVATIKSHFTLLGGARVLPVQDAAQLQICTIPAFMWQRDTMPCATVLNQLPQTGTLIEFSHPYFAG